MLAPIDRAWLAGFIDGEGYVGINRLRMKGKEYYQASCFIRHTHEPTVDHALALLARIGIEVPVAIEERGPRHKDSYFFRVTGMERVLALADAIEPYSVTKKEQWAILRAWCESRLQATPKGGYTIAEMEIAERALTMNKRGPI